MSDTADARTFTGKQLARRISLLGESDESIHKRMQNMTYRGMVQAIAAPGPGRSRAYKEVEATLAVIAYRLGQVRIGDSDISMVISQVREAWERADYAHRNPHGWADVLARQNQKEFSDATRWHHLLTTAIERRSPINLVIGFAYPGDRPSVDFVLGPVTLDKGHRWTLVVSLIDLYILSPEYDEFQNT